MGFIEIELVGAILNKVRVTEVRSLFSFSAKASRLMHFPRVVIYLFIRLAYSNRLPFD